MANVDKHHIARVLRLREVRLRDTVAERSGRRLIDGTQGVQVRDLRGGQHGTALAVREPDGHREDDVAHRLTTQLVLRRVAQLGQVHGEHLRRREDVLLTGVVHLDTDFTAGVDQLGVDELLLDVLNRLVVEGATDEALERPNRVLEVGRLRGGRSLTNGTRLVEERHKRRRAAVAHFVCDNVDAARAGDADSARLAKELQACNTYLLLLLPISRPTTLDIFGQYTRVCPRKTFWPGQCFNSFLTAGACASATEPAGRVANTPTQWPTRPKNTFYKILRPSASFGPRGPVKTLTNQRGRIPIFWQLALQIPCGTKSPGQCSIVADARK